MTLQPSLATDLRASLWKIFILFNDLRASVGAIHSQIYMHRQEEERQGDSLVSLHFLHQGKQMCCLILIKREV